MTKQEAKQFINSFVKLRGLATDEMSLQVPNLYPTWKPEMNYSIDDRVLYNNTLYKVITAHTSQDGWAPDAAVSLFAKVLIPDSDIIPNWEQPESTNPYMNNDKVNHNGKLWVSVIDNNVWEPGSYGWNVVE